MIDINFGSFFSIELLHKYYADQLCPDFNISVSNKTTGVVNGHKMLVKQYNNQLYAGIQSIATGTQLKAFTPVEQGMQLTFFLWLNNPLFPNYTNLASTTLPGKIYYFTNRNNNVANGTNFLTAKIAAYNSAKTYNLGDLAANATGLVYRAIKGNKPGNQFDLTKTDYWMPVDDAQSPNQYQSEADALQWMASLSAYKFAAAQTSAVISVLGYDTTAHNYTKSIISKTLTFPNPLSSFALDLTTLDPGKYSLTVNGKQQWIYINDELNADRPFAVIDIFADASPASSLLVDGTGMLKSPKYALCFLNRATIWKYILASGNAANISDPASLYQFSNSAIGLTSVKPIPLSNKALTLNLTVTNNSHNIEYTPIPCADPQRLAFVKQGTDTYSCSEIYLNY